MMISQPTKRPSYAGFVIPKLLSVGRQEAGQLPSQQAFRYLYLVSKVRGPKVALRWFSHEVSDLEPVLSLLEKQSAERHEVRASFMSASHCKRVLITSARGGRRGMFCCCGCPSLSWCRSTFAAWMATSKPNISP